MQAPAIQINAQPHTGQAAVHSSPARFKVLAAGRRWGKTRLGVFECLDELPESQREIFIQQAIEGRTFKEVSEQSGVSINTLLARKRYAVQFLRERLADMRDVLNELS